MKFPLLFSQIEFSHQELSHGNILLLRYSTRLTRVPLTYRVAFSLTKSTDSMTRVQLLLWLQVLMILNCNQLCIVFDDVDCLSTTARRLDQMSIVVVDDEHSERLS